MYHGLRTFGFLLFVGISVELGARVLLGEVDSVEMVLENAFPRLLNSAVIGGVDAPLGARLSPNVRRTVHWGELAAAMQLVPILQPDQVIVGYFVGNDPLANTFSHVYEDGHVTL